MPKSTKSEIWMCKIDQNRAPTAQNRALTAQNRLQTLKISKPEIVKLYYEGIISKLEKTSQIQPKPAKIDQNWQNQPKIHDKVLKMTIFDQN